MANEPLILDSVTHLKPEHAGRASICASHGGIYAAYYAAKLGTAGVILNDAGIGREQAGLAGIGLLEELGVPAAAISHDTARIGDGADCYARGVLSFVNTVAESLGLHAGMSARDAIDLMTNAGLPVSPPPPKLAEAREFVTVPDTVGVKVAIMDSISLIDPLDEGQIVVAASHGAILGTDPKTATKVDAFAIVCNDAGFGIENAGISRLAALDGRGIAGACVSNFSARIGDGRSSLNDGFISALNDTARARGGMIGQSCIEFVQAMAHAKMVMDSID